MSILDLWLPILVSGVICFVASSVIWVVIKWHNSDYKKADREGEPYRLRRHNNGFQAEKKLPV